LLKLYNFYFLNYGFNRKIHENEISSFTKKDSFSKFCFVSNALLKF
jgi:hypothetical protein